MTKANEPESLRDWLDREKAHLWPEVRASRDRWKKRAQYLLGAVRHYRLKLETVERLNDDLARSAQAEQERLIAERDAASLRWQDWQKMATERSVEIHRLAEARADDALRAGEVINHLKAQVADLEADIAKLERIVRDLAAAAALQQTRLTATRDTLLRLDITSQSQWKRVVTQAFKKAQE